MLLDTATAEGPGTGEAFKGVHAKACIICVENAWPTHTQHYPPRRGTHQGRRPAAVVLMVESLKE
jgi:hypothetical protein